MNQNKKAFTLIELLAVIVILAIIALIAVPVILNIIDKANKSAFKDTAYGIISAGEYYWSEQQLEPQGMLQDVTFDLSDERLGLKGDIPEGSITITRDGEISLMVKNNRYCVTKSFEEDDITVTEEPDNCKMPVKTESIMTSENTCVTNGKCSEADILAGIKVNVKVNEAENYDFYVISDTGTELTLIMDRNIGNKVAWYTSDDETDNFGPITVLNYLNSETSSWTNIPAIKNYTYDNNLNGEEKTHGYQKLEITNGIGTLTSYDGTTKILTGTSVARLITTEEVNNLKSTNGDKIPTWLYTNLSYSNTTEQPYGYWFLTAKQSVSHYVDTMWYSRSDGPVVTFGYVIEDSECGARPVITLSK